MTGRFVLWNREDRRVLGAGDFPLALGGEGAGDVAIGGQARATAHIGLSDGYLFIQPAPEGPVLYHNGNVLQNSTWLADGDRLAVNDVRISISASEAEMVIRVVDREAGPGDTLPPGPPDSPPPRLEIEPVAFRPDPEAQPGGRAPWLRAVLWAGFLTGLALLLATAGFVFTARQLTLRIEPTPDSISLSGGLYVFELSESYLLKSGHYTLEAVKEGYKPLSRQFEVDGGRSQTLTFKMEKLPGFLSVAVHELDQPDQLLSGAEVVIDGEPAGMTPLAPLELPPGTYNLSITAERYLEQTQKVEITGSGTTQSLAVGLVPGWSGVTVNSMPEGARVAVDGEPRGKTPITLDLMAGSYSIRLSAPGFKSRETRIDVAANTPRVLEPLELQPADAVLTVRSNPSGAGITVGKAYKGQAPIDVTLAPGVTHRVRFSKPGYQNAERSIQLASNEKKTLSVNLTAVKGVVYLKGIPPGATLSINGKAHPASDGKLALPAFAHRIKVTREGFEPFETTITPRPGFDQEVRVAMKSLKSEPAETQTEKRPTTITAGNGYAMKLVVPGAFKMGSSRREQGRRSNETLRKIQLKRPFYMGVREVTNREFRAFAERHNSGVVQSFSLNLDDQPVAGVTWEQAARFCNWLSDRNGLPKVYVKNGSVLAATGRMGTGYRLATEAEWEYCARFDGNQAILKYPWGKTFPPKNKTVNIADTTARDLLAIYVSGYTDGYAAASPTGKFPANALGLYDMGGNVAEWCHDFYSIYGFSGQKVDVDPAGPADGRHHVIRGSSWKHGSISTLRSAYRDYGAEQRIDVGFRICRYLEE